MKSASQIKALRKKTGLTQEGFSDVAGFTRPYISQLERGTCDISLSKFLELCEKFEIDPKEIL